MPRRNNTPKHQPFVDNNTCQSKRRFASEQLGQAAAETQELQTGLEFSVYKCDRCGGWHLTRK